MYISQNSSMSYLPQFTALYRMWVKSGLNNRQILQNPIRNEDSLWLKHHLIFSILPLFQLISFLAHYLLAYNHLPLSDLNPFVICKLRILAFLYKMDNRRVWITILILFPFNCGSFSCSSSCKILQSLSAPKIPCPQSQNSVSND